MTRFAPIHNLIAFPFAFLLSTSGFLLTLSEAQETALELPAITELKPSAGSEGSNIEIKGERFGHKPGQVLFEPTALKPLEGNIKSWSQKSITVQVPILLRGSHLVRVVDFKGLRSNGMAFSVLYRDVHRAIEMKKSGMSVAAIVDIFDVEQVFVLFNKKDEKGDRKHESLRPEEIKALREAGFEDDFIRNWLLVPSYVTIGPSIVWLTKANDVVAAIIVRVYTPPKSFLGERPSFLKFLEERSWS